MKKITSLLFLAACTLAPRYERPETCCEEAWRTPLTTSEDIKTDWWKQFGDPVLGELIQQALYNNQDLKTAIARVDQYQAQLMIARSQFYPQVSGEWLTSRQKISTTVTALPPNIKPIFNIFGIVFKASYLVDLWGEVRSGAEAAYHAWLSVIEARRSVVLALVSSVASSYIQLRQLDQQLKISEATKKTRDTSLYLAKIRFELGLTSDIEVEQATAEVQQAELKVEEYTLQIAEVENQLSFLLGIPSTEIPRGRTLDEETMPPTIPAFLPSDLLNNRPDVRAAEERLMSFNANIGVARAQFFPQINLAGGAGTESVYFAGKNGLFTKNSEVWNVGTDILQQIFTGFALTGELEEAKAMKKEALHAYLSTTLKAYKEANDALTAHKIYLEEVETQRIRVEALQKYLHLADLRYKEGQTDYLTYLDAERYLFEGLLDYETAKGNSFLSYIQIYQSFGGEWVEAADAKALEERDCQECNLQS
ncbi:MAG: efflux transporter outer membrane subunit [Verrucomicrobiota bacterium]|nr:efflux transporter outer membrane subunit [Verrucomicrobiota bacterium]